VRLRGTFRQAIDRFVSRVALDRCCCQIRQTRFGDSISCEFFHPDFGQWLAFGDSAPFVSGKSLAWRIRHGFRPDHSANRCEALRKSELAPSMFRLSFLFFIRFDSTNIIRAAGLKAADDRKTIL